MQEIVFSVQNKNIKCVHSIQVEGVSMLRHICAFSVLRRVIMKLRKRGYVGTTSTEMSQREKDNAILAREAAAEGFVLLKNEAQTLPTKRIV